MLVAALDASVETHSLWSPVRDDAGGLVDLACVYTNESTAHLAGLSREQLTGIRLLSSSQLVGNDEVAAAMIEVARSGVALRRRVRLLNYSGEPYWLDLVAVRLAGGLSVSGHDVTAEMTMQAELKQTVADLARLADTDPLTGLGNRRTWTRRLSDLMRTTSGDCAPLVVALIDLDRFKDYNDAHGHLAGDDLLREVSTRWRLTLPSPGIIARIGGEEFAVALPHMEPAAARDLLVTFCSLVPSGQTCSAGMTLWDGQEDESSVMRRADAALYAAKHAGRNRVEALLGLN